MPTYIFYRKDTQEEWTEICTISEMETMCEDPNVDTRPALVFVGDAVRQNPKGKNKPSEGFRDVLRHIKRKYKGGRRLDLTRGVNTF